MVSGSGHKEAKTELSSSCLGCSQCFSLFIQSKHTPAATTSCQSSHRIREIRIFTATIMAFGSSMRTMITIMTIEELQHASVLRGCSTVRNAWRSEGGDCVSVPADLRQRSGRQQVEHCTVAC